MRRFLSSWLMLCCIGIFVTSFAVGAPRAQAATLTVTNLTDSATVNGCTDAGTGNGCTLREAIIAANADPATTDTIVFASNLAGGTITLTSVLPDIKTNLSISNPATPTITLARSGADGIATFRILRVNNGTSTGPTVNLSGLTLTNGNADYASAVGAAGGGILNNAGTLTLTNCAVSGNLASDSGGGLDTEGGALKLINCTVAHNSIGQEGGGLGGGGISNYDGTVTLINTTLATNFGINGGGLFSTNAATLTNCTVSGNTGDIGGGGLQLGGTNTVSSCTITGNVTGANNGGGIDLGSGSTTFSNNIIAGNTKSDVDLYPDSTNKHVSNGYNLVGTSGTNALTIFKQQGDQVGVTSAQLKLGTLANNGGPTQTIAVQAGSIAINAGNPGFDATSAPYDQRGPGYSRVYNGRVDSGAYEAQPAPVPAKVTVSGKVYNAVALAGLPQIVVKAERQSDGAVFAIGSDSAGNYSLTLNAGTYTFSAFLAHKPGFIINPTFANPVTLTGTPTTLQGYNFRAVGVTGRIISPANVGISGVTLNLYAQNDTTLKSPLRTAMSDSNGFFSLDGVAAGTYLVAPTAPTTYSYTPATRTVTVTDKAVFTSFTAKAKSAPKAVNSVRSAVVLSSISADAQADTVTLKFTGALDAASGADFAHYEVRVGGTVVSIQDAQLSGGGDTLVLTLPHGALTAGSPITVGWSGVLDSHGLPLQGTAQLTAA